LEKNPKEAFRPRQSIMTRGLSLSQKESKRAEALLQSLRIKRSELSETKADLRYLMEHYPKAVLQIRQRQEQIGNITKAITSIKRKLHSLG